MDFWTSLKVLLSRWYVVVPALLATAGASLAAMTAVPPSYEAKGSMVLLVPATVQGVDPAGPGTKVNPYLEFGASQEVMATLISQVMMSEAVAERLRAQGATGEYEVGNGDNGGPIVNVIATGDSEQEAITTVTVVTEAIGQELAKRQEAAGAPRASLITARAVTTPTKATRLLGSRIRALGAVAALGVAGSIALAFMAEGIAEGRRRRRGPLLDPPAPGGRAERLSGRGAAPDPDGSATFETGQWVSSAGKR